MEVPRLMWSSYMQEDTECSGSFFTSVRFLSTGHRHDFYELCLITEGRIAHNVNGVLQELSEGDLLFIRPEDRHSFEKIGDDYFQFVNLAVRPHVVDALFEYLSEGFQSARLIEAKLPPRSTLPKSDLEDVKARLETFILSSHQSRPALNTELRIMLAQLFGRHFPVKAWESKTAVPVWLEWLHHEMQKTENFVSGIPAMQRLACKSPEHLCREFRKNYGTTPTQFVGGLRLNYARRLLIFSDKKIIDIALIAGFQNLSHFCHEFKQMYGMTPSDYRERNQNMIGS